MPSVIALIITIIFIIFLLGLDRKQNPSASYALWLPTLWLIIATGKPLAIWFGTGGSLDEGSSLDRNFQILLLCIGFLVIKKRNVNITGVLRENASIVLLIGFMLISISWSNMPFISFKRWIRDLVPIVMALIIASESDPRQALQSLFRRMIYIQIPLSYLLINYYPYLGRLYGRWSGALMWIGVSTQKNGLTTLCMFAIFYFVWTYVRRRKGHDKSVVWYQKYIEIFLVCLSAYLFMGPGRTLTYSATAFTVLVIFITSFGGMSWLKKHNIIISAKLLTVIIIAIIIYGTVTPFLGGLTLIDPSAALNRDSQLTGRNRIWEDLIPYAMQRPVLGHGYGGFWTDAIREACYAYPAHNGYLETILATGFVGVIFLSIFLLANCLKAQKLMSSDFDWGAFWFSLLLGAVARNISESAVMSTTEVLSAILVCMMISLSSYISKQMERQ